MRRWVKITGPGFGGIGDYAESHGNTYEVMSSGHQIRDHVFANPPHAAEDTGEVLDFVIVGGGLSGLGACPTLAGNMRRRQSALSIENHRIFGGEAKQNEFLVDGHRLVAPGKALRSLCNAASRHSDSGSLYASIGVDAGKFEYQAWQSASPEIPVGREHRETCFGPPMAFTSAPASASSQVCGSLIRGPKSSKELRLHLTAMRAEILKYRQLGASLPHGQKPHELDAITMEHYMMQKFGISQETIRKFLMPGPGDGYGIGPDVLSAYAFGFGGDPMNYGEEQNLQSFAGGNGGFARHLMKTLLPDSITGPATLEGVANGRVNFDELDRPSGFVRVRLGATVVRVEHEGPPEKSEFVRITYTRHGKVYRLKARAVVITGGSWTTKHVVIDLPSAQRDALRAVLPFPLHDRQCSSAELAVPV